MLLILMLDTTFSSSTGLSSVTPPYFLLSPLLFLSFPVSFCSSWLLWGGVGHLVFSHQKYLWGPRGPKVLSRSCGSVGQASIQLCSGFGFWHGPVSGERQDISVSIIARENHRNERAAQDKRKKVSQACGQNENKTEHCCLLLTLTSLKL